MGNATVYFVICLTCSLFIDGNVNAAPREPEKEASGSTTEMTTPAGWHFDKNVTSRLGKTVYLNCHVKNLGNSTVSWIRHRDVLTVDKYTYTSDRRFQVFHHPYSEDWTLRIKYVQHRDTGVYECQISSTPHVSHFIYLNVIAPTTDILEGPELYIDRGTTINLTCVMLHSPEPAGYIFWYHNKTIIRNDSARGGVSVLTETGDTTTSLLVIQNAKPSDSGQYKCSPSNAQPKSVNVHVLN